MVAEDRTLPQDPESEQALLGAVLLDSAHLDAVRGELTPADFWSWAYREIFRAMLAVHDAGGPLDLEAVSRALEAADHLEAVGGRSAVSNLIDGAIRLANVRTYVARIRDKSQRRGLIRLGNDLAEQWAHEPGDVGELLARASERLDQLRAGGGGGLRLRPVRDCAADPEPVPLIRRAGDRRGSVLAVGEVALLAGQGKVGKSTLARQLCVAAAACPGGLKAWKEVAGLEVAGGVSALVTFEDTDRRTFESCRLLEDPLPEGLGVMQARGHPLFGVREGEHLQARPQRLPAWFRAWAQIRQAKARLVVIDPVGSAFLGNSASVEAARAFIDALRTEAERAGCGVLLVAHSTKAARKEKEVDADDPGQVAGSAAFSDAARAVMVLAHERLSMLRGNYSQPFTVKLEPIRTAEGRFAGFREAAPPETKGNPYA